MKSPAASPAMRQSAPQRQLRNAEDWALYELRKAEWKRQNPSASQAEYDRAIRKIVGECGV
jgi:hypothetical protein